MFHCNSCSLSFSSPVQLGRHRWRFHVQNNALLRGRIRGSGSVFLSTHEREVPAENPLPAQRNDPNPQPLLGELFQRTGGPSSGINNGQRPFGELSGASLRRSVFDFYEAFRDKSVPLWDNVIEPPELGATAKALVDFCLERRSPASFAKNLYDLVMLISHHTSCCKGCSSPADNIVQHFKSREEFYDRILVERRFIVKLQGWREASITTRLGNVDKGVYRPLRAFLEDVVIAAGGPEKLLKPEPIYNVQGQRVYSSPLNSDAMIEDWPHAIAENPNATPVYFSLYCDKTMLAGSGAGDGMVLRARIENLVGHNLRWHDVGYAPSLSFDPEHGDQKVRDARLELFHRFLYLLLKDITQPSETRDGNDTGQRAAISPRPLCLLCDKPQEREFLGLMRGQSHQDCSHCTFRSMEERNFINMRRAAHGQNQLNSNSSVQIPPETGGPSLAPPPRSRVTANSYESRNVRDTVSLQLKMAFVERNRSRGGDGSLNATTAILDEEQSVLSGLSRHDVRNLRQQLALQSALKLPSALCTVPGMVCGPARLFKVCGIDVLHTFDLGLSRQFCDDTFKVLARAAYSAGRTKAELVRICNKRIKDLPADSGCCSFVPFKTVESDKQASFTGKHRRELAPFLWYAVLGLHGSLVPDEDELFISALFLDAMQADLRGINHSKEAGCRTAAEIWQMQRRVERGCDALQQCFQSHESSKYHRLRVHLADHLFRFGNLRTADTSENETLHKTVKRAYKSTNKQLANITPQLLQVNTVAQVMEMPSLPPQNELLLPRNPRLRIDTVETNGQSSSGGLKAWQRVGQHWQEVVSEEVQSRITNIRARLDQEEYTVSNVVIQLFRSVDEYGCLMYSQKKSLSLFAQLEWEGENADPVRQVVYAGDKYKWWGTRHDCVIYKDAQRDELRYGIVERLLMRNRTIDNENLENGAVAIIRPLNSIQPEPGNSRIVQEFGFTRLQYVIDGSDVRIEAVLWYRIKRKSLVVLDMWEIVKTHGYNKLPSGISDTPHNRLSARFFVVKNFRYSSLGEELLEET